MSGGVITPQLVLRCGLCEWRPPLDSTMEAFTLHSNVEHDTDDYAMNLVAVCTCGAEMTHTSTTPHGVGQEADHFLCVHDNTIGLLVRTVKP